jgi:type III secretion protein X
MSRVRDRYSPFPMDSGIDRILRRDEGKEVETGPAADISPAFSPLKPRLEQLYALPNLEDYLAAMLAPLVNEPLLLLPNRFNNALRDAVESLDALAEEDPRLARLLSRAARMMRDQVALRELVQMYRSALLKG